MTSSSLGRRWWRCPLQWPPSASSHSLTPPVLPHTSIIPPSRPYRCLHLQPAPSEPDTAESQLSSLLDQHTVHLHPVQSAFLDGLSRAPSRCVGVNRSFPLSMLLRFVCHSHPARLLFDSASHQPGYAAYLTPDPDVLRQSIDRDVLETFYCLPPRPPTQRSSSVQSLLFAVRTELRALCLLRLISHAAAWPHLVAVNDEAMGAHLADVEGEKEDQRFDCLIVAQQAKVERVQPSPAVHPATVAFHDVLTAQDLTDALKRGGGGTSMDGGAVWAVRVGGSWFSVRLMHDLYRLARLTAGRVDRGLPS